MNNVTLSNKRSIGIGTPLFGWDAVSTTGFKFEVYAETEAEAQAYAESNLPKAEAHERWACGWAHKHDNICGCQAGNSLRGVAA